VLLSILIPVYNERTVVRASLAAVLAAPLPPGVDRELIIVDDCSKEGTWDILREIAAGEPLIRLFRHEVNRGKGAAVRTSIGHAQGDFCLIQDADLEYDPGEYPRLLKPLLEGRADAVFGSRYMAGESRCVLPYWHTQINRFLTFVSNFFSNLSVTDMETCYKVFRTDLLKSIPIRSDRFGFEPEITMKCAKRRLRIYEVPISYHGRTYEEGKKIGWKDGLQALEVILRFWLIDDLYNWTHNRVALVNLTRTPAYVRRLTALIRPLLSDSVLELGAGIGTFSAQLMGRRLRYLACEHDPLLLHTLSNHFLRTPNVETAAISAEDEASMTALKGQFDSAVCLHVLEGSGAPEQVLRGLATALKQGGNLVLLAPQGPGLFGSVDQAMGQERRFSRHGLQQLLGECGFEVERIWQLNKAAVLPWWINSRLIGSRRISKVSLKIFDKTVWLWRILDRLLPTPGLTLLINARRL
jgi:glycosyltransferase involved in cell wall biosynthesis